MAAEQTPHKNDEAYTMRISFANTVSSQNKAKGRDTILRTRRRPYFIAIAPGAPPKKAPRRESDAIHDPCSWSTLKDMESLGSLGPVCIEVTPGE